MTHEELCERARRWLAGSRRCDPVFSNIASCREIPDAIGWSSCCKWSGSTVIECKASIGDFRSDRHKYTDYKPPGCEYDRDWHGRRLRIQPGRAKVAGYEPVELPRMGDYRFYMCADGVLSIEMIQKHAPGHGLLHVCGRTVRVVLDAARRTELVDKEGEIRYLRFAIINRKTPFVFALGEHRDSSPRDGEPGAADSLRESGGGA